MTYTDARAVQFNRFTIYTIFLVGPDGQRERVGTSQQKSGRGLMAVLCRPSVQERVKQIPGIEKTTFKKKADRLEFSNGWKLEFGGTLSQEAGE